MARIFEEARSENYSVSVALCTYNGSRYLGEQLASIAAQTKRPAELVVCDDGSQDRTIAILEDFAAKVDFPVRVHRNEQKLGPAKNFEQAVRLCRGEFIALSDQDDWWSPTKLDTLLRALQRHSAGGVFSDGALMDDNSMLIGGTLWSENRFDEAGSVFNANSREYAISELLKRNIVTGATLMFRSDLREILTLFPDEWVHDGWMAWMIVLHSRLIAFSEPLVSYRVHRAQQVGVPGSVTDRLRRGRERGIEDNRRIEQQFRVLHEYAQSHSDVCDADLRSRIESKRRNSQFRADLPGNRIVRLLRIAANSSAYKLYAQGWLSMVKDALA